MTLKRMKTLLSVYFSDACEYVCVCQVFSHFVLCFALLCFCFMPTFEAAFQNAIHSLSTSYHQCNKLHVCLYIVYISNTTQNLREQREQPKAHTHTHIHTPYQKNAKLSTLNHHKLLCFKYYLYLWRFPLSISSASLFVHLSWSFHIFCCCCLLLEQK